MNHLHVRYLLVGGGIASSSAAEAIRKIDPEGPLLLVAQEINRPYHRPPLSKEYLLRQVTRDQVFTHPAHWFHEQRVELRTGRRAARLDAARRAVTLDSGEEVSFDTALIATGGQPAPLKIPGADLPNLFYLRTIEDEERLRHAIEKALAEGRPHEAGRGQVCIIGGGLLGVELSSTLTRLGMKVHLVVGSRHPWRRFVGEATGSFIARFLDQRGVTVHPGHRVERLEGDGRVQRAVLSSDETIPCDLAVAAVGISVGKELLRGTPLTAGKALLVDEHCRTNMPGIFAAGDCAAVFDPRFGKHRHLDHWAAARYTGVLAGRNMTGAEEAFDDVGHFTSEVFGLRMAAWGEPRLVDRRLLRGTPSIEQPDFVEIGVAADGRITQLVAIGYKGQDDVLEALVRQRALVDGNEEELKDPATDLSALL